MKKGYVIGIDYGSDSCRALVVDVQDGRTVASSVCYYPRWKAGMYCDASQNRYRQHPLDYIESLECAVKDALTECGKEVASHVKGIAFDTTGSTPVMVDRSGTPLALLPELSENPDAMFILWKDHTAAQEAAEINELAHSWPVDYTQYSGGSYSSEWFWAKALHVMRNDALVREQAFSIVEHCDWMPALLTGNTDPIKMKRSRCAAGHKAMWNAEWGGFPSQEFLSAIDPLFDGYRSHISNETDTADTLAGYLTEEWSTRLGLPRQVAVAVGVIDAHSGAIGAGIEPHSIVRIMGTSTCDIAVASYGEIDGRCIGGICGQVDGSVLPGMIGMEAGQSAFGDIYAWFRQLLMWPLYQVGKDALAEELSDSVIPILSAQAQELPLSAKDLVATDWFNGRRTPYPDLQLQASITGLTLGTTAPVIFKALVEATAFGSLAIIEDMSRNGITIDTVIAVGGISQKSPYVMQVLADVLGMPIKVSVSGQACAFGAAMLASVASGIFPSLEKARQPMNSNCAVKYFPSEARHAVYLQLYTRYKELGCFSESSQK